MGLGSKDFFSYEALFDRLTDGIARTERPVVFLVGSALNAPVSLGQPGVPNVAGVIDLIRAEFTGERLTDLDKELSDSSNRYQAAFSFLLARRGQNVVNDIVKRAIWQARKRNIAGASGAYEASFTTDDELCKIFDADYASWELTPAARALGELVAYQPKLFGQSVLTTNFDPLVEVGIGRAGAAFYRTVVHRDGNLAQTEASGCHVVHLHGYWYGADTLHTPRQLTQERPRLRASLAHMLRGRTLVVLGYGGWDDVFTSTLLELIQDDRESVEVIWALHGAGANADQRLFEALGPGVDRGVVTLYEGVNCHDLLPELAHHWRATEESKQTSTLESEVEKLIELSSVLPSTPYSIGLKSEGRKLHFEERHQDRPPLVDYYVGRAPEATRLDDSSEKVVYLTGIGGQGKSALAGNYLSRHRNSGKYDYVIWRDCKEEAERFESQIMSVVYGLIDKEVNLSELSQLPIDDLISLFIQLSSNLSLLLVFDNVDHYVDLESNRLLGSAATFSARIIDSGNSCRVIFTCRPSIMADGPETLELRLRGIDLEATKELFRLRQVSAPEDQIVNAHNITDGHAFWLDLIAAQLGRNPEGPTLEEFLQDVPSGGAGLPVTTLKSIWDGLKEREQVVLRGLAEAVRPISAHQLADCLNGLQRWNQVSKAIRYLRGLNLIVIKLQENQMEVLELHPLVRAFVRNNFKPAEQKSFIDSFLKAYLAFFGIHRNELAKRPRPETVDRWLEAAEVCTQSGRYEQAYEWLNDVLIHVQATGHLLDFIRVGDILVRAIEWTEESLPAHFDDVFSFLISSVATMGRQSQTIYLLEKYKDSIPHKNARYINYCDLMCHCYWIAGDYLSSIKWGVEGTTLKSTSGVDTKFDAAHSLALAQRDSGAVDEALKFFLKGEKIELTLSNEISGRRHGGPFYGNIGRCLHLSGQLSSTLTYYRKSAQLIEDELDQHSVANKGYIRQWVGEIMYSRNDIKLASAFFSAALACWELVAPPKAEMLHRRLTGHDDYVGLTFIPSETAERAFLAWVREDLPADLAA